eukprot:3028050-Pyramimonas_sp.AAC.2
MARSTNIRRHHLSTDREKKTVHPPTAHALITTSCSGEWSDAKRTPLTMGSWRAQAWPPLVDREAEKNVVHINLGGYHHYYYCWRVGRPQ